MTDMNKTLGSLLSDKRIAPIAGYAIRNMDLTKEDIWNKTLAQLRDEGFGGDLAAGFERLFGAAESGKWYYPLYSPEECEKDASLRGVNLVYFPSSADGAEERPYILLVPGGGFVNVWNLTEGWPVAARFNRLGYHVLILTYQVSDAVRLLDRNMGDFARALFLAREHAEEWKLRRDSYITCGFSAGGYLVCLWNVPEKGYAAFGLPKPRATFPVYPLVSWTLCLKQDAYEPDDSPRLFGCSIKEAAVSSFEIPGHAQGFPPCALFLAAEDTLVPPDHSRMLAEALDKLGIPCRLEIGPKGGHGFADGTGMCMEGWPDRAIAWYESLA